MEIRQRLVHSDSWVVSKDDKCCLAGRDIRKRLLDLWGREMDEAIPAKYQVNPGQRRMDDIENRKMATRCVVSFIIRADDRFHYVAAQIVDAAQIDFLHPVEVATGDIEQRTDTDPRQQGRKLSADIGCICQA